MLADENSPVLLCGLYQIAQTLYADEPKISESFKTGRGFGWHEHDQRLFGATERFFRPGYNAHLVPEWIPALDGVEAKLKAGASVADVGCGLGTSTIVMAQAYPKSTFVGYDYHDGSIATFSVKIGNEVLFTSYGGTEVKIDGEELLIMTEDDVLAVVE